MIYDAARLLSGAQQQIPPVFSAIKKDGKKAYELARKGEDIVLKPRNIFINNFEITDINLPLVQFKITCSKGTYIRSIANDFGKLLQSGAYLNSLCRTQIGKFKLENAYTMQDLIAYFGEEISLKTDL
jgi:tRNA pseudouridine55 synthase